MISLNIYSEDGIFFQFLGVEELINFLEWMNINISNRVNFLVATLKILYHHNLLNSIRYYRYE